MVKFWRTRKPRPWHKKLWWDRQTWEVETASETAPLKMTPQPTSLSILIICWAVVMIHWFKLLGKCLKFPAILAISSIYSIVIFWWWTLSCELSVRFVQSDHYFWKYGSFWFYPGKVAMEAEWSWLVLLIQVLGVESCDHSSVTSVTAVTTVTWEPPSVTSVPLLPLNPLYSWEYYSSPSCSPPTEARCWYVLDSECLSLRAVSCWCYLPPTTHAHQTRGRCLQLCNWCQIPS